MVWRQGYRRAVTAILSLTLWMAAFPPMAAQAQTCGLPGLPDCPPQPTDTPSRTPRPRATSTPTPSATLTLTSTLAATATATPAPCDTNVLTAVLSGNNEVGPVVTEGQGTLKLLIDVNAGTLTGNWVVTGLAGPITAAHIHNGPAGVNAGVYLPFSGLPALGGSFATLNSGPVVKLQAVLGNPPGFYVNIHTQAHPGGEIRGQLACAPAEPVASPTPTATETPVGGPGGGGGSFPTEVALGLAVAGALSLGLGLFSMRRSTFNGGVRLGLILIGGLSLLGAILLGLLNMAGALPGSEHPAASPTFDFSTIQIVVPLFGLGGRKQPRPSRADDPAEIERPVAHE